MVELGCAQEYRAIIHWRGGGRPYTSPAVDSLTQVRWSRTINDVSQAEISIAKSAAGTECCGQLGKIEPWIHELSIYRDSDLVWQGPVLRLRETTPTLTVEAWDMLAWLRRVVNTFWLRFVDIEPDDRGRKRGPVQEIAETIIRTNLVDSSLSVPPDWCNVTPYIVRQDAETTTKFEKDGENNDAVWAEYVLNVLDEELTPRGLEYTTVGRSMVLRGPADAEDAPQVRLFPEDILGDVEVVRDGTEAATFAFATTQETRDISGGLTVGTGEVGTPYGRLDWLVRSTAENVDEDDLRQMARQVLGGRYPAPTTITIPDGAQLAPTAPVTIHQLVAGERIDFVAQGFCMEVEEGFRLADLEVTWGASGEQVGISLVPLFSLSDGTGPIGGSG